LYEQKKNPPKKYLKKKKIIEGESWSGEGES
jgi:hypothetical protein